MHSQLGFVRAGGVVSLTEYVDASRNLASRQGPQPVVQLRRRDAEAVAAQLERALPCLGRLKLGLHSPARGPGGERLASVACPATGPFSNQCRSLGKL